MPVQAKAEQYGGLDRFRMAAALMVIAIHTAPLSNINSTAELLFTNILCRVAVPFFLMVTGQFVLAPLLEPGKKKYGGVKRFVKKSSLYYLGATVLYLPVIFYSGRLFSSSLPALARDILVDGTMYHLWYFPASITGVLLVALMAGKLPKPAVFAVTIFLYGLGLLGDSYYAIGRQIPAVSWLLSQVFLVSSYTRNGLFYAPVFLWLGAVIGRSTELKTKKWYLAGCLASLAMMLAEGMWLHRTGIPKHDSMYLFLLPAMVFLYRYLMAWKLPPSRLLREGSLWVYILHPLVIVLVRGASKFIGLKALLVENSLVHYATVAGVSVLLSFGIVWMKQRLKLGKKEKFKQGRAWIEVSRSRLINNIEVLSGRMTEAGTLMPAVKANAYGHGLEIVAEQLIHTGVQDFCVACASEGEKLRRLGAKGEILILGYTHPKEFYLLKKYRLTQTVSSLSYAEQINECGKNINVQLKIDTGMHRQGIWYQQNEDILQIFQLPKLEITGVYSHLCTAGNEGREDLAYTCRQKEAFWSTIQMLKQAGVHYGKAHLLSTNGVLFHPEFGGDAVRVGIGLYGLAAARDVYERSGVKLQPVLSLKARVALVKGINQGEAVGYDRAFTAAKDMKIAVLAIGYADGLPRVLSCGRGSVLIHGEFAPIVGKVCMDQTIVDVSGIQAVEAGDEAVIIGSSGSREISAYDVAEQAQTITNDLLSGLGERLERILAE